MNDLISKLFQAVEAGETNEVVEMLKEQPSLIKKENEYGLTLLGIAAHYGKFEVIQVLLQFGAEVNAISHSKLSFIPQNTALHAAIAGKKSIEVIELLLQNGADCNIVDSEGFTPLHIAAFEGNIIIADLLLKHGAKLNLSKNGKTPIQIAEERGNIDFVNFLKETIK